MAEPIPVLTIAVDPENPHLLTVTTSNPGLRLANGYTLAGVLACLMGRALAQNSPNSVVRRHDPDVIDRGIFPPDDAAGQYVASAMRSVGL